MFEKKLLKLLLSMRDMFRSIEQLWGALGIKGRKQIFPHEQIKVFPNQWNKSKKNNKNTEYDKYIYMGAHIILKIFFDLM